MPTGLATTGVSGTFVTSTSGTIVSAQLPTGWSITPSYTGTSSTSIASSGSIIRADGTYYVTNGNSTNIVQVVGTGVTSTCWTTHAYVGNSCVPPSMPKVNHRRVRTKRDQARKALWRSIRLFENLFGIAQIKIFIDGGAFEIEGRKFNYRISQKRHSNLINNTMNINMVCVPYNLEVLSKQGLVLFEGCTIFKETPIIDQITALILHILDNEENVLLNMNLSKLTDDFFDNQELLTYVNELKGKNYQKHARSALNANLTTGSGVSCTPDEYEQMRSTVLC